VAIGLATTARLVAIALPAVVLFATIDPTDLADGLAQRLRLPSRFVLGALAGLRLVGLFVQDWRSLELARRARGVADTGRLRRVAGQVLALLVLAIRRGSKLATAMEARGFDGPAARSWARPSPFGRAEALTIGCGVLLGAACVAVAVLLGTWNFILT
jgi:energy-coupling factor transport system permease protein